MLWTTGAILLVLWLLSFISHAGWWVHLILAVATIGFVMNVLMHDPESSWA
jgi:hypothetical protein